MRPSSRISSSPNYKWWAFGAVAIGLFLTVMDQSGVNIALPTISDAYGTDLPTTQWISLAYILCTSALLMPMGRLSDMVGRKIVYMAGFSIFVVGAAFGGLGQSFGMLVAAKIIQGVGSAAIQGNGMAMITEIFSENEHGKSMGLYMAVIGIGSISGPIIGGFLVSGLGWRAVFFASVPVGILALIAVSVVIRARPPSAQRSGSKVRFDWLGAVLSSGALVSLLLSMTNAHKVGWSSTPIIAGFTLSVVLLLVFLVWEGRTEDPILDLGFFKNKVFSMGISARVISFLGGSAMFFLMPFYLVQALGYSASKAGLLMVPASITMAVTGPISGLLSDKIGTRWPTVIGMILSTASMLVFSQLSPDSGSMRIIIGMALSGAGMGTFQSGNSSAIMSSLGRERFGIVAAFLNMTRTSANVTGIAMATTIVVVTMGSLGFEPSLAAVSEDGGEGVKAAFVTGFNRSFMVSAALMVTALVISLLHGVDMRSSVPSEART